MEAVGNEKRQETGNWDIALEAEDCEMEADKEQNSRANEQATSAERYVAANFLRNTKSRVARPAPTANFNSLNLDQTEASTQI
mmetsp:Transcript_12292/g.14035  ORF Transcript_12292/g.14035 Transcript_12292/m.14035 type:complete len:83 (+) Transcript_12292:30-278(+)